MSRFRSAYRWVRLCEDYRVLVYPGQIEILCNQEGLAIISPGLSKDFHSPTPETRPGGQEHRDLHGLSVDDGSHKWAFWAPRQGYFDRVIRVDSR